MKVLVGSIWKARRCKRCRGIQDKRTKSDKERKELQKEFAYSYEFIGIVDSNKLIEWLN